jgi:hypothetical protein
VAVAGATKKLVNSDGTAGAGGAGTVAEAGAGAGAGATLKQ